jgi:hypothetical protein
VGGVVGKEGFSAVNHCAAWLPPPMVSLKRQDSQFMVLLEQGSTLNNTAVIQAAVGTSKVDWRSGPPASLLAQGEACVSR